MLVSKLTGAELDYWVAMAEGREAIIRRANLFGSGCHVVESKEAGVTRYVNFDPSSKWMHGGPLIEKYRITLEWSPAVAGDDEGYVASMPKRMIPDGVAIWETYGDIEGDTPLIAACRCIVSAKYGDQVPEDGE